jgi:hypothetical protein
MYRISLALAAALVFLPGTPHAEEGQVPTGKETLVIDGMSKAKAAAGKKVVKGPVTFAHQGHASVVACTSCHHKDDPGSTPEACSSCHEEKAQGNAPKLSDAFHGGDGLPALQSCIGCHVRTIPDGKVTNAPRRRDPCDACHDVLKK